MKTVVILGMHCSGTSMVAGILQRLGIDIGDDLVEPSVVNPFGHFENREFYEINKKILAYCGGDWLLPPLHERILQQNNLFSSEIIDVINKNKSELWGWKDPRTVLTIELFFPYLENPYFIVCNRDDFDIAASLNRRNGLDVEESMKLIKIYDDRINGFFKNHSNLKKLDLYYEAIRNNPFKEIEKIISFLDIAPDDNKINGSINFVASDYKKKIEKIMFLITHSREIRLFLINMKKRMKKW
jgi:hypothetical protein